MEGQQLPHDINQSEMDTSEDLRKKIQELEEKNLELTNQRNQDMSHYEKEKMKLRLQLQRAEALRQELERELSCARKEAQKQMDSAEDELRDVKNKLLELQALNDKYQQNVAEIEKMFQSAQLQWEEERQKFAAERDNIRRVYLAEMEFLIEEKTQTEKAFQDMNALLQKMLRKLRDMEVEHHGCNKILKLQANHLDFKDRQKERLVRELEMSHYEKEKMKLRLELQRGEALRGVMQNERTFARKEAEMQMNSTEDELNDIKTKLLELQARWGEPRHRTYTISGTDITSGGTPYRTNCSIQLPFVPQGISTPRGPAPDVRCGEARHRFYFLSATNITSGVSP